MDFRLPMCSRTEHVVPPVVMTALGFIYSLPWKPSVLDLAELSLIKHAIGMGCISLIAFHVFSEVGLKVKEHCACDIQ